MSKPSEPPGALSPDDALPPVQPPSAGFIVQLFVVPAVIVLVIVMVWVMFNWLAQMGNDPHQYLEQIRKNNDNSWIAAHNLAEELRTSPTLKTNASVAQELGVMLSELIEEGGQSDDEIQVRVFLCRALGEFQVVDGLPALIQAATTQRSPKEVDVRRSALEAISLLLSHRQDKTSPATALSSELWSALLSASRDPNDRVREGAAYALGLLESDEAVNRLEEMLDDAQANVRFNAATGLARQGNLAASNVLVEMLDVEGMAGLKDEEGPEAKDFKRALIVINALRATKQLADESPDANLADLQQAVDDLLKADIASHFSQGSYAPEIRVQAETLQKELAGRAATVASP